MLRICVVPGAADRFGAERERPMKNLLPAWTPKLGKIHLKYLLSFALGILLATKVALVIGVIAYYMANDTINNTARREYARGLYDSCVSFGVNMFGVPAPLAMGECMKSVVRAMESGEYYETPSPGFEWPSSAPAPMMEGENSQ